MRIIIDAMGGDNAPAAIIEGAVNALEKYDDVELALVGKEQVIREHLAGKRYDEGRLSIVHAGEEIEMAEPPVEAIRKKKDSSMVVGMKLSAESGDLFITAGSTGAAVAGATLIIRRLPGIKRPALAPVLPTKDGRGVLLIDCGANVDCKPEYLRQFALMGSVYMERVMGFDSPRVGLINNGAEEEKGCALTKAAYQLLANEKNINFAGNAEGRELLSGAFDVLVCDGFTGNIVMKFLEGVAGTLMSMLMDEVMQSTKAKLGMAMAKPALRAFKKKTDFTDYGGALLLGVRSGVIKAHGSSNAKAIESAVRQARGFIAGDVVETIRSGVEAMTDGED